MAGTMLLRVQTGTACTYLAAEADGIYWDQAFLTRRHDPAHHSVSSSAACVLLLVGVQRRGVDQALARATGRGCMCCCIQIAAVRIVKQ